MKVVGIIAEYNPFHNGHAYQIQQLKAQLQADYVIIAMSGNFLQRGVPALCDKYTRAEMALRCGADLILELPTVWATASAEYFAKGSVKLLSHTGVVTHLGFGAESDDLGGLRTIAAILKEETPSYRQKLNQALRLGQPFPLARKQAVKAFLPQFSAEQIDRLFDTPNNILALEYLKALPRNIAPVLIQRKGANYHDSNILTTLPSATAIRQSLLSTLTLDTANTAAVANAMPEPAYQVLKQFLEDYCCMENNDFSSMLGCRLLTLAKSDLSVFADCSKDLSNKIQKYLPAFVHTEDFIQTLKSKDMTYTRISRCLLHILLNITQADYQTAKALDAVPYLRILGFKKTSSQLLSAIKQHTDIPMITKMADASALLSTEAVQILERDLFASSLYYQCMAQKSPQHKTVLNEFTHPLVIL